MNFCKRVNCSEEFPEELSLVGWYFGKDFKGMNLGAFQTTNAIWRNVDVLPENGATTI